MATLDNLRDKWDSITPRERALVVLLGAALVVTVFLMVTFSITDRLDAMDRHNHKMRRALDILQEYRIRPRPQGPADPAVNIGAEPMKMESYVINTAKKVGIGDKVPKVDRGQKQSRPGGIFQHPYQLQVNGLTIEQTRDFLEALETDNKLVAITGLTVKRSFADRQQLDVKIEVSTYSDPSKAPAPADGAAPGAPGAPGVPGGSP
jgi:hypothetical protein